MAEAEDERVRGAAAEAEAARAGAVDAREDAEEAREAAREAQSGADKATSDATQARDVAVDAKEQSAAFARSASRSAEQAASAGSTTAAPTTSIDPDSRVAPDELLIHPDEVPDGDSDTPFGEPGPPMSRRAPFYVGFVGALGVLTGFALILGLHNIRAVLVLVLVSAFLAVGLNPIVEWFMHRGIRRRWSVLIVTLGVVVVVTTFLVTLVPVLQDQVEALIANAPRWLEALETNARVQDLDDEYQVIDTARVKLEDPDLANTAFGSLFTVGLAVLNALLNAFLIFVLTLYFLASLPEIKRACFSLAPASRRTRVTYLGDEILRRVGGYVAGAFVVSLTAGVSSFIFLELVGLAEYAVALALVVALLDFVPLIGATIGASLVTLIGFAESLTVGVACAVFYLLYQQGENYLIYPRVMRSSVQVPGVVTVIAVLIGGSLLGVVGALLAIPTAAALLLLVREVWLPRQDQS
ncbi:MAG: AI-2E family transporter [Nocardioidaceae bacterium]|nr:AI-2E family transporter [Nocardioidaceae bacterium]